MDEFWGGVWVLGDLMYDCGYCIVYLKFAKTVVLKHSHVVEEEHGTQV